MHQNSLLIKVTGVRGDIMKGMKEELRKKPGERKPLLIFVKIYTVGERKHSKTS